MKNSSSTPKGKFFPPIRTAASFLRTVSKSPELTSQSPPNTLSSRDIIPDLSLSKQITSYIKDSGTFTERATASRKFRDYQQLQEVLKSPEPDRKSFNHFNLPTSLDQLRLMAKSSKRVATRKQTRFKEKPGSPTPFEVESKFSLEDSRKFQVEGYSLDNCRLKDWLQFMKMQHFSYFFKETSEKPFTSDSGSGLEAFQLVLRIAWQECIKLVSFQSMERGEIIAELLKFTKIYKKVKNAEEKTKLTSCVAELQKKVDFLLEELNKLSTSNKEKEDLVIFKQFLHEIGILKSTLMIKEVDIQRHVEHIKRLKADRTFRIKKDLERYNQLLTKFNDYRSSLPLTTDPVVIRSHSHKRDSIKDYILTKLNVLQEKRLTQGSRLTEEQLIEHQMLTTNTDFIFFDKQVQADIPKDCCSVSTQVLITFSEKSVLTEELLDIFEEEIDEPFNEPFKHPNIMITNEDLVEIKLTTFTEKFDEISIIEDQIDFDDISQKPPVRRRVNSYYRWRENLNKGTQTDENVFIDNARQEEEELLEWMIKDRKDYLTGIKKQIYHKKNELSKVHLLVSKSRSMLGDSFNLEDSKSLSFLSSEESQDVLENEIVYLKSVGLLNSEVEIDSWKNGYYYGYEKGKNDAFTTDPPEPEKPLEPEPIQTEDPEPSRPKRRNTIISENLKMTRRGTKVQEFHFQHKDSKSASRPQVKPFQHKYIDDFLQESSKNILKLAKMSRKMMIKTISSLYSSAAAKKSLGDVQDLATFLFDEFSTRFGQKIMNKKLIEFLASVMKYPDSRRVINFAKLIGISKKIGLEDYARPKECFDFLLELINLIQKSNLGIIFNIEEGIDYQFIPAIRAVECSKEILTKHLDSSKISAIVLKIEQNSHPDPKKINKFGIIDQEFLSEMLLIELDSHYQAHVESILTVIESFYSTRNLFKVFKQDIVMIVRHVSTDRFGVIGNNGEGLQKYQDFDDQSFCIPLNKVVDLCVQLGLLTSKDLENFLKGFNSETIQEAIQKNHETLKAELLKIFEKKENFGLNYLYVNEWQNRFESLIVPGEKDWKSVYILWTVLVLEVQRLSSP